MRIDYNVLIGYTDWERQKWHDWLEKHPEALKTRMGPHGYCQTVGEVVKHIFSAENRYIDKLLTNRSPIVARFRTTTSKPFLSSANRVAKVSRISSKGFPAPSWDIPKDFEFVGWSLEATPKKIVIHVLTHEIRHWAQIATVLRLNGCKVDLHDFIFTPVLGGEFRSEQRAR